MPTHYHGPQEIRRALDTYIKLMRAANAVTARVHGHLAEHGLSISQFGVLEALFHLGPLSQGNLARKILKSPGNMTMVIDNLEKRELVRRERMEGDRRSIRVQLTDKGRRLIAAVFPPHVAGIVEAMGVLASSGQEQLARLCKELGRGQGSG